MKHQGCILEFTEQRNKELMNAYKKAISDVPFISNDIIGKYIVETPCSRFWVSEERATAVIREILKGRPILQAMRPTKRKMFVELYNRVKALTRKFPNTPLNILVMKAIHSPAPEFYMLPRCAMEIIYKIKKKHYTPH